MTTCVPQNLSCVVTRLREGRNHYLHLDWALPSNSKAGRSTSITKVCHDPSNEPGNCPGEQAFDASHYDLVAVAALESGRTPAQGRGAAVEFKTAGNHLLLKQYRRGGFARRFSQDRYFYTGFERTRAVREVRLLAELYEQGLPVPQPIGCRVKVMGAVFECYLLTRFLKNCKDLSEVLKPLPSGNAVTHEQPPASSRIDWSALGRCLSRFRSAGVFHADLNISNIMMDDCMAFYLIDFDRGFINRKSLQHRSSIRQAQSMLDRLMRSIDKHEVEHGTCLMRDDRDRLRACFWD